MSLIIKCCIRNNTQGDFVKVKQKDIINLVKANQMRDDNSR